MHQIRSATAPAVVMSCRSWHRQYGAIRIDQGMHELKQNHLDALVDYRAYARDWSSCFCCSQACSRQNFVCVPLYDTLGENAIQHIIKHAHTKAVFASAQKLADLTEAIRNIRTVGNVVRVVVYWGREKPENETVSSMLLFMTASMILHEKLDNESPGGHLYLLRVGALNIALSMGAPENAVAL